MKHIIFSEGKHDAHFMCMALQKHYTNPCVDWFLADTLDGDDEITQKEEPAVRDFVYGRDSGYLVKSEEGDNNLQKLFSYYCEDILLDRFSATVVADLDSRDISILIDNFRDELQNYYRGKIELPSYRALIAHPPLRLWELDISAPTRNISRNVKLVTFDGSFEDAASIDYSDTWSQRSIDINNYCGRLDVRKIIYKSTPTI